LAGLELICSGLSNEFSTLVGNQLESAAQSLNLADEFRSVEVCADDFSGQDGVWFGFHPPVEGAEDTRAMATLYCSAEVFCRPRPSSSGIFPGVEIWEQLPGLQWEPGFDFGEFSVPEAERFLHHNLLLVQDLVLQRFVPSVIPESQVQAFASAWSVTVDGRLSRKGLPGYSLSHRRGRFSGLFSSAGVLLPGHWDIFQSLWDGALTLSSEVLSACRQLPRLAS
jgi:hypothetical protein